MSRAPAAPEVAAWLERPGALDAHVLEAAESFFTARGDVARARWATYERQGFPAAAGHLDLLALFGDPSSASIIPAVLRARLRRGRLLLGEPSCVIEWPHFFVESVEELRAWRDRIDAGGAGRDIIVDLRMTSDEPSPRALSFPPRIFADVLQGIAIELADAVRRGTA